MKKIPTLVKLLVISFYIVLFSIVSSCAKEEALSGTGKALEFVELKTEKDTIVVQEVIKVTATVIGEGVSYSWKCDNELAVIEGSGAEILFTICHAGKFRITCEVSDSNNKTASKDVYVTTVE